MKSIFLCLLVLAIGLVFVFASLVQYQTAKLTSAPATETGGSIAYPVTSSQERSENACLRAALNDAGFHQLMIDMASAKNMKNNGIIMQEGDNKLTQEKLDAMVAECEKQAKAGVTP